MGSYIKHKMEGYEQIGARESDEGDDLPKEPKLRHVPHGILLPIVRCERCGDRQLRT